MSLLNSFLKSMVNSRTPEEAEAIEAERQKGLNAIPFDSAIDAYPEDLSWDPETADNIKNQGMLSTMVDKPKISLKMPAEMVEAIPSEPASYEDIFGEPANKIKGIGLPRVPDFPMSPEEEAAKSRKQEKIQIPEEVVTQPNITDINDRLTRALSNRREDQLVDAILRAGAEAGNALAGKGYTRTNTASIDAFKPLIGADLEDIKQEISTRKEDTSLKNDLLNLQNNEITLKLKNKMADKESDVSDLTRQAVSDALVRMGAQAQADKVNSSRYSYDELTAIYGRTNLSNMLAQYENQKARLEAARIAAAKAEENKETKKEDKETILRKNLRAELTKFDEKSNLTNSLSNYKNLKDTFDQGQFNGIDDIKALYTLIKALDPESVVRESEVDLMRMSQPGFSKVVNAPNKFFKGNIFDNKYRQQLLKKLENLVDTNVKSFRIKSAGTLNEIRRQGLDPEEFLSDELPLLSILTPSKTQEAKRNRLEELRRKAQE